MNYTINLILDNREKDLCNHYIKNKEHINNKENKENKEHISKEYISKENLDLGDIIIKINDKICVLIERKTISDLDKSIKDGRYKEQKNRIIHSLNLKIRKIYLIEGTNMNNFKLPKSTFTSVIYNTMIRDNIHIIKSNNIEETIKIIDNIYKRCNKFGEKIYKNIYENNEEYKTLCHIKKKNNITKEICYLNQYQQIPGISKNIAEIIYNKYGSLKELYNKYNTEELINDFKLELSNLKHGKSKRRIGMKTSNKICLFL